MISAGELLGVLTVESKNENAFNEDDIRLLSILSLQVAVGMRNARMYAEIEKMAVTDPLTGLYNYRYFYQRLGAELARSQRYHHPLSIIMIDLDDFKKINDHCGHLMRRPRAAGSRPGHPQEHPPLRRAHDPQRGGARHRLPLRRRGVHHHPARYALGRGAGLRRKAEKNAGRPRSAPSSGLPCNENSPQRVTGSFGVAAFQEGETLESMIKRADTAMYQAKEQGKNRVVAL